MSHDELRRRLVDVEKDREAKNKQPQSLWDLVNSIHSAPTLREWVTIESRPLYPLVVRDDQDRDSASKSATVHLLLALPASGAGEASMLPPWAYIRWRWPSCRLLGLFDLSAEMQCRSIPRSIDWICTKKFVDSVEDALAAGESLPLPSGDLTNLYEAIIEKTPRSATPEPVRQQIDETGIPETAEVSGTECESGADSDQPHAPLVSQATVQAGLDRVASHLSRSRELIDRIGIEEIQADWRRINARLGMRPFSVAVVGEFSRGKSTLINKLLDRDVLPVGNTPMTATLARIRYGPQARIFFIGKDSGREELEFNESSWDKYSGYDNESMFEGFLLVELPNKWLQQSGIDLIDTPGAGDLNESRTALVTQTIASCDAALVTINATMALSMTERAFIEEHVLSKGTPRVAVVVTRLDQLPKDKIPGVLSYVRNKLQDWAPDAIVCSAHGSEVIEDSSMVGAAGPSQIRDLINSWTEDPDRLALISQQVALQLQDLLGLVLSALEMRLEAYQISEEERSRAIAEARGALDREALIWEELRLKLDSRELALEEWLDLRVMDAKPTILESLMFQLNHSKAPKEWWDSDLPFLMRRELKAVSRTLETALHERMQQDAQWLLHEVRQELRWDLHSDTIAPLTTSKQLDDFVSPSGLGFDLTRTRDYARIGTAVLTVGAMAVVGPLALIGGVLAGVAAEKHITGKIEEQKKQLSEMMAEAVERTLEAISEDLKTHLRTRYKKLLTETIEHEATWAKTRLKALEKQYGHSGTEEVNDVQTMIAETVTLLTALSDSIEGGVEK